MTLLPKQTVTVTRYITILFVALLCNVGLNAQILSYTNNTAGTLNSVATNATGTPLTRVNGAASPGAPCGSGFSVSAFTTATVYASGLQAIEVTATPDMGFTLNVTGFTAALRRSGSGPASVRYAYSTDGGINWIDQGIDQSPNNATCGTTTTGTWATVLSVPAPLQLRFRVYGFNAGSASAVLQLLNVAIDGTVAASAACAVPPGLTASFSTTTAATLNWSAIAGALSYNLRYRPSGATTWSSTTAATASVVISGLTGGTVYECEVETVCASGTSGYSATAFFTTLTAGTPSASSGKIAIYFNRPVNTSVSTGVNAIYLNNAIADTIVAYLNRAKYTVDIAQYSYNQSTGYANIATAVNNCLTRGVRVRWIYDASQANTGLALLNPGVHLLGSPTTSAYGIMHNKFVIIDANSNDPNDAIVSTGSTNWGITQLNTDPNNILFIQDSAFARAYRDHFNMMWGDTGVIPNMTLSKFGPFKTDLGAHIFNIGGKTVELYFSPADHTDARIQSSINSANTDLYFGVFTFTQSGLASTIVTRNTAGVYTPGIVDENSTISGGAYPILTAGLGSLLKTATGSVIYHNKMLIVDPSNACSDPQVLTGSHNWSNAADTKNDENTIIIHSDTIANIYYQSFHANYSTLGGTLTPIAPCAPTSCGTPSGLFVTSLSTTSALLNWSALSGALSYNVRYRVTGSSTWSTTSSAVNSATITTLFPGTAYEFQVQAVCASGTGSFSATSAFTTLALPCSIPSGLTVSGIDTDIATLNWVAVSGAVSYNVQYRIVGAASWLSLTATTNTLTLSGMTAGTNYEFQVQVVCASGTSAFSAPTSFTTDTAPIIIIGCSPPLASPLPATGITEASAMLNWRSVSGAISYNIRYHKWGSTSWILRTATTNWVMLYGLSPATTYEFQVQAVCGTSGTSVYNSSALFSTASATGISSVNEDRQNLSIYPNPTSGEVNIQYHLTNPESVRIAIYDILGRQQLPAIEIANEQPGDHDHIVLLPKPGIYFVKSTIGNTVKTDRVIKL